MSTRSKVGHSARPLPSETKRRLRELHRLDSAHNARRLLAFALVWAGAGWVILHTEILAVRCAGYFLIGATIQGLAILMHDAAHGSLFANRRLNRWFGFLCGWPALIAVSGYRVAHLPHHRYERGAMDPDELENVSKDPRVLALLFGLVFLGGDLFGFYRVGPFSACGAAPSERRAILLEYACIVAVAAAVVWIVPGPALLHLWVFPALFARQLTNVRTLAEHVLTGHEDRWTATRSVVSNAFVRFFMCNVNLHIEHHLFPAAPWYRLPEMHRLLADEEARRGAQVYRSYTRFLWDLARWIARAYGPGGAALPLHLRRSAAGPIAAPA